jgi:hypothetical protein
MHNLRALHGKLACQPAHKVYGGSSNQATKQPAEPSILLFEARSQLVLISSKIPSTISTSDVTSSAGGDAAGWLAGTLGLAQDDLLCKSFQGFQLKPVPPDPVFGQPALRLLSLSPP